MPDADGSSKIMQRNADAMPDNPYQHSNSGLLLPWVFGCSRQDKRKKRQLEQECVFFFLLWLWMTRTAGRNHDYCTLLLLLAVTGCLFVNLFDPSLPPAAPILPAPWTGWLTDEVTFFPG